MPLLPVRRSSESLHFQDCSKKTDEVDRTKLIDDQKREVPRYRGLLHGTLSIVREEGIGGIYRGLFPVVRPPPSLLISRISTDG